ncbi:hypothetical protein [Lacinutrix jangbogonensis]|uniref:hypothetical protein n=1 Tax=Lacinutrix jangbogonensis TaxID=1469557 RepID=UPI000A75D3BF|nr:hypothetical protein [Lacinutrix jangbogonensis]
MTIISNEKTNDKRNKLDTIEKSKEFEKKNQLELKNRLQVKYHYMRYDFKN